MGYLIAETTREEREKIVAESLGNIEANCDGCMAGLAEMYQDYIDGKKELREINMEFNARYIKEDIRPERMGCFDKEGCYEGKTARLGCVQVAQFSRAYFIKFHKKIFRINFKKVLPNQVFSIILIHVVT